MKYKQILILTGNFINALFMILLIYYANIAAPQFFNRILMTIFLFFILMVILYNIFPIWFRENLWYCHHCHKIHSVGKKEIKKKYGQIKHYSFCSQCGHIMTSWKENDIDNL